MKNEIILFENQDVRLEVNMKDETVWLSLEQMAKLFDRDRTVITRHINNIFKNLLIDYTTKHFFCKENRLLYVFVIFYKKTRKKGKKIFKKLIIE